MLGMLVLTRPLPRARQSRSKASRHNTPLMPRLVNLRLHEAELVPPYPLTFTFAESQGYKDEGIVTKRSEC